MPADPSIVASPPPELEDYRRIFDLTGRSVLVTGASRGIGSSMARGFAAYGASVAVHYASAKANAEEIVETIKRAGRRSVALGADLSVVGEGRRLARAAVSALGQIDVLVANASIDVEQALEQVTDEDFDRQINVNFRATVEMMQELLPEMAKRQWGRVLTIGSVQQVSPNPRKAIYAATKCAQASLSLSMAKAYAASGIAVNNLAPGLILTDRTSALSGDPDIWRRKVEAIPAGRVGVPDDMVGAAILLCSDAGSYITAQDLMADGGLGRAGGRR